MQPHPPSPQQPRVQPEQPQLKSRLYVQLFSWFGLLISVLHLFEGRSIGICLIPPLRKALVSLLVSNTFPNLAPALQKLLTDLSTDVHFFSIFSAVTSVLFDIMAAYWAFSLHADALAAVATSELHAPLLRPHASYTRPRVAGFGTLSRPGHPTPPPRTLQPFPGRGHRLGAGDP
ncbi:hypothetical protein BWQ96_00077 [Gracilariopsis chorda]|uniref:Uncharacterized protein n=1 Tax=Gracilariopsis chorda TaxID=448386 RepID=A0A2V3J7N7_9FLOR|nr:hypothetical protein BWQ96_00077 [Gracilariopsis chorda]|eukprot:PXF49917.1 hypothetical protein BWQ96_00077 [Gracilariopsis chorda]